MSPGREIFTALLLALREKYKDTVFDGFIPLEDTPYPFIYLADATHNSEQRTKQAVFGMNQITVHFYDDSSDRRGTLSEMMFEAEQIARNIKQTDSYSWSVRNTTEQIIPDMTTSTPLLHGVLIIEFTHTWR